MGRKITGKSKKVISKDDFQREFGNVLTDIKTNEIKLVDLNNQIYSLRSFKKGSTFRALGGLTPFLKETQEELKESKKERTKVKRKIKQLENKKEKLLETEFE